jgi:hypothetical protein
VVRRTRHAGLEHWRRDNRVRWHGSLRPAPRHHPASTANVRNKLTDKVANLDWADRQPATVYWCSNETIEARIEQLCEFGFEMAMVKVGGNAENGDSPAQETGTS